MANYFQKATTPPPHPPILHFVLPTLLWGKWLMNERLSVADPSRAAKQSNSSSCRLCCRYCKEESAFQGRYNCSWHMRSFTSLVLIRVNTSVRHLFWFFSRRFEFISRYPGLSSVLWKKQKTMQPRNITCFRGEKMSCLSPGCHFPVKWCYAAPWCRLPGPSSVFKHCIKMQERFRKHDTCYPSTSNLTLLDFQMYCKMQRCVAVVKKKKKFILLCILMIKPTSWELNQIKMKCRVL